jgi:cell division protease FtsH
MPATRPPQQNDSQGPQPAVWSRRATVISGLVLLALFAVMWVWGTHADSLDRPTADYSALYTWAQRGAIASATLKGRRFFGTLRSPATLDGRQVTEFWTELPERDDALLPLLREKSVKITVERDDQPFAIQLVASVFPWLLMIGAWIWLSSRARGAAGQAGMFGDLTKSKSRRFDAERAPNVTFEDIAGLAGAKRDLQEVVQFLKQPDRFRRLGAKVPRGVLLIGPPGTGKTLLARAVAGESGVPFYSVNASEFVEMFVGLGAARVRDLFAESKKNAPAIVFIDEIDAVGRTRGAGLGLGHDEREQTLNQLLAEMDGFSHDQLVVVLAATNRPDVLDPALLRPGRFDRRVVVDRPELAARRAILGVHAKGKPLAADVDLQTIAESTPGFSGADLANLVNEAAINATRRGAETVGAADFAAAYDKIVLGDRREGKLGARERGRVAVHEGGHAVVARFLPETEPLRRVSILPRGLALGATQQAPPEDRHLQTRAELQAKLAVLMGGYAAEKLLLGDVSTGAESDLKQGTELAMDMVAHYGMSDRLGPVYYEHRTDHPFLGQRIATEAGTSDATVHAIEDETRRILGEAGVLATEVVTRNRPVLDRLIAALLEKETLERGDLDAVFGAGTEPVQPAGEEQAPRALSLAAAAGLRSARP